MLEGYSAGVLVMLSHPIRRELLGTDIENLYNGVLDIQLRGMRSRN